MKKKLTFCNRRNTVVVNISTDRGGNRPYFSITGEVYAPNQPLTDRNMESRGCVHEEILKVAPHLQPIVDIHLSDLDGVPMYAEENGWYWLAKAAGIKQRWEPDQTPEKCAEIFAKHCRISLDAAEKMLAEMRQTYQAGKDKVALSPIVTRRTQKEQHKIGCEDARALWKERCAEMIPRWKKEAEKVLDMIEKL